MSLSEGPQRFRVPLFNSTSDCEVNAYVTVWVWCVHVCVKDTYSILDIFTTLFLGTCHYLMLPQCVISHRIYNLLRSVRGIWQDISLSGFIFTWLMKINWPAQVKYITTSIFYNYFTAVLIVLLSKCYVLHHIKSARWLDREIEEWWWDGLGEGRVIGG